jgi:creatinine amidohydrolase
MHEQKGRSRRDFLGTAAAFWPGVAALAAGGGVAAAEHGEKRDAVGVKSLEEMRPGEIVAALQRASLAFVPVSPMVEWHSLHLPLGTDALICEAISRELSTSLGGVWFRPLSFGLDSYRTPEQKRMWGIPDGVEVYGMEHPAFPVKCEYCQATEIRAAITNRVGMLKRSGVRHVVLLNHHGGAGQFQTIEDIARELSDGATRVHGLKTYDFNDLGEADGWSPVGGHAGYAETTWLLAFRPELVDLEQLPEGELRVYEYGILHERPLIEERWNPRHARDDVARRLHDRVLANLGEHLRRAMGQGG